MEVSHNFYGFFGNIYSAFDRWDPCMRVKPLLYEFRTGNENGDPDNVTNHQYAHSFN